MIEEDGYEGVVSIAYHSQDVLEIPEGASRWEAYYGSNPIPSAYFDGLANIIGGYEGTYGEFRTEVNARQAIPSPLTIDIRGSILSNYGYFSASIVLEEDIVENAVVRLAVVESHIQLNRHYNYVLRDLLPEEVLTIHQAGDSITIDRTFDVEEDWNFENMGIVVFVQDDNTREVLQAKYFDASESEYRMEYAAVDVPIAILAEADQPHQFQSVVENSGQNDDTYIITMTSQVPQDWECTFTIGDEEYEEEAELPLMADGNANITINFDPNSMSGEGDAVLEIVSQTEPLVTQTLSFHLIADVNLLIVDDSPDTDGSVYEELLAETDGLVTGTWQNAIGGLVDFDVLAEIPLVIWFTGEADNDALIEDEQNLLIDYLDQGGRLLVSGQNIGNYAGESEFYTDYLGAHLRFNDFSDQPINGIEGDPIGDGLTFTIDQSSPDVIIPQPEMDNVFTVFQYGAYPLYACLRHDAEIYRTVYFSIGVETILEPTERDEVINRTIDWLQTGLTTIEPSTAPIDAAARVRLEQNVPNPFNPTTNIRYELAQDSQVNLAIYDITGKLVKMLVSAEQETGMYDVQWNGTDDKGRHVDSGVYLYQLKTDSDTESHKMILLK